MGRHRHQSQKSQKRKRRERSRSAKINESLAAPKPKLATTKPSPNIKIRMIRRLPPPLVGGSLPLSLAVYRPASLFAMLLIAALAKNTFSLRWLALGTLGSGSYCQKRQCRGAAWVVARDSLAQDHRFVSKWDGITIDAATVDNDQADSLGIEDSTLNELLQSIPRGGGGSSDSPPYSGLINLGNTCYLNAQLQCAYHVPLLREMVLGARDEVADVEVEVDDEEVAAGKQSPDDSACLDEIEQTTNSVDEESTTSQPKKTIIKQEVRPISPALRALQQTFRSLDPNSGHSSGSTQVLCRSLGINPYIQQDGQEFWKLFVPEVDYDKLTELYTGYYDDYIREIVEEHNHCWEEKKDDDNLMVEQVTPRERVRTDPFLDLSIPVTEGTGCSVEESLRETFVQPEILRVSEGNGWRPSKDAEKVDAYKGLSLKREGLPSLLQLHLKRFKYDWETGETSKINDRCTFPLELDLSEALTDDSTSSAHTDDAIYDLQSVVIHRGEYGSGHYYSYVRPDIDVNEWYRFDDQVVTPVDYSEVVADAYGGKARKRRANSFDDAHPNKKQKGILRRIFSFGSFGRDSSGGFGYGGRTSSAYMIQYVRRSDRAKLHY
ncbi:hypothetical protein ACHAWO_008487 [Cyclotella atomus]|uniref:Ubiquitin carboxyl-terminal hydrolase n=1 Tax=Cyclotella atomus TaxID=382360 RepID=A0ABD3NDD4_9STRA